ncbi:MAG: hypothetical protein ACXW27_06045 [Allosphingosinicella sp.]
MNAAMGKRSVLVSGVAFFDNMAHPLRVDSGQGFSFELWMDLLGNATSVGGTEDAIVLHGSTQAVQSGTPQQVSGGIEATFVTCIVESIGGTTRVTYQALR